MSKDNVVQFKGRGTLSDALTKRMQTGAQQLLARAIEADVNELLASFRHRHLANGRAAVVRNGHPPERDIQTGLGPVTRNGRVPCLKRYMECLLQRSRTDGFKYSKTTIDI